jgi:hypothetical protein
MIYGDEGKVKKAFQQNKGKILGKYIGVFLYSCMRKLFLMFFSSPYIEHMKLNESLSFIYLIYSEIVGELTTAVFENIKYIVK